MSYNNYGQSGYGQSNPYGQSSQYGQNNPYGQSASYGQSTAYGQGSPYGQGSLYGQSDSYGQPTAPPPVYNGYQNSNIRNNDVEMQNYGTHQKPTESPEIVLNDLRSIDSGIATLDRQIDRLQMVQRRPLDSTSGSSSTQELESINSNITTTYRGYLEQVKKIKSRPQAPMVQPHIQRIEKRLKSFQNTYMRIEHEYQQGMREQAARQYRIVRPDASDEEVRQATEDPQQQVFSQALLNSDRRGQSRQVLSAVRERHEAIQKIERQLIELAELFNEMESTVVQQEEPLKRIEDQTFKTQEDMVQANVHMDKAVKHGYDLRRHKWMCFWISVVLLLIIAGIVAVIIEVNKNKSSTTTTSS